MLHHFRKNSKVILAVLGVLLVGGPILVLVFVLGAKKRDREPRD